MEMTELLYMKDCYIKEFDANVIKQSDGFVVLDKTAFYPEGGGQPADTGTLNGVRVKKVRKENGEVRHYIESPVSGPVHGVIDWETRYAHMRMHTAQHLVSAIALREWGCETIGNQIHADHSRIDFALEQITPEMREFLTANFNKAVDENRRVSLVFMTRDEMLTAVDEKRRKLFERVPANIMKLRVVEIEGLDKCPCAGTHVANTREIGHIEITNTVNKGSGKTRLVFRLK